VAVDEGEGDVGCSLMAVGSTHCSESRGQASYLPNLLFQSHPYSVRRRRKDGRAGLGVLC
jgi:hypothetical protein